MENQVGIFNDPEVLSLKTELRELEERINNLTNEKLKQKNFFLIFNTNTQLN